jgi:hypothetical protein
VTASGSSGASSWKIRVSGCLVVEFGGGCFGWHQRKAHDLKIADGVAPRLNKKSEIFSGGHGAVTVAKIVFFFTACWPHRNAQRALTP